ncbi:MAG: DUF2490 domain-containing protein [Rikenellaceae bacterium]
MKKIFTFLSLSLALCATSFNALASDSSSIISSLRGRVISPKVGNFSFFLDQEVRATTSFGSMKDSRTSGFVLYDPLPWLRLSTGYALLVKGGDDISIKHRAIFSLEESVKFGNFGFTARERLETTFGNGALVEGLYEDSSVNLLRTRLKINYNNGKQRAVPYIYVECYNHTNDAMTLSRVRSHAGVEYKLSPTSKLTGFYQYAHFYNYYSGIGHTFGLLYVYTFKKK